MSIQIGLIDSGVNLNHPLITLKDCVVNGWKGDSVDFNDSLGHGTLCAHLILGTAEFSSKIYNIKVFDKTLKTSTKKILKALQWCIDNNIKLINLSLSVPDINYYYEFKRICDEASQRGIFIVASADNIGRLCLPSYLDNVLGVGVAAIENDCDFYYTDSSIQLYSKGTVTNLNGNPHNMPATSFATARMTGIIASILHKYPNIDFNQLKNILLSKSLPFNNKKILIKNEEIDFNQCTIPISLSKYDDISLTVEELSNIDNQHIVKSQKLNMALINLAKEVEVVDIELKLKNELAVSKLNIIHISSSVKSEVCGIEYSFSNYRQIPEKLQTAYAKALIETVNINHPETELIIIGMEKSVVPFNTNSSCFFDKYTIPEISLLFGFQIDASILIVNELTEFEYIQRNIKCLKSLFDIDVIFLIYSSLYASVKKNKMTQNIPNFEQIKRLSEMRFLKLQNELKNTMNLKIYDIYDKIQSKNIADAILEVL